MSNFSHTWVFHFLRLTIHALPSLYVFLIAKEMNPNEQSQAALEAAKLLFCQNKNAKRQKVAKVEKKEKTLKRLKRKEQLQTTVDNFEYFSGLFG